MLCACAQDGEQEKQKSYLARCRLPCALTAEHVQKINSAKELLLKQTTPTRVEQRRAMLVKL
jgi:tRNA pseudouridine synthase 10